MWFVLCQCSPPLESWYISSWGSERHPRRTRFDRRVDRRFGLPAGHGQRERHVLEHHRSRIAQIPEVADVLRATGVANRRAQSHRRAASEALQAGRHVEPATIPGTGRPDDEDRCAKVASIFHRQGIDRDCRRVAGGVRDEYTSRGSAIQYLPAVGRYLVEREPSPPRHADSRDAGLDSSRRQCSQRPRPSPPPGDPSRCRALWLKRSEGATTRRRRPRPIGRSRRPSGRARARRLVPRRSRRRRIVHPSGERTAPMGSGTPNVTGSAVRGPGPAEGAGVITIGIFMDEAVWPGRARRLTRDTNTRGRASPRPRATTRRLLPSPTRSRRVRSGATTSRANPDAVASG